MERSKFFATPWLMSLVVRKRPTRLREHSSSVCVLRVGFRAITLPFVVVSEIFWSLLMTLESMGKEQYRGMYKGVGGSVKRECGVVGRM